MPDAFNIRPARAADEAAVYEVCLQTGAAGQDATALHDDPRALGNIYVGPYLRLEPDLAFVLEDPTGVCGYVLGALDTKKFFAAYVNQWLPPLRAKHPEPAGDRAGWTETQKCYHDYHHPDLFQPEPADEYPSHLHIDLLPRAQGQGWGVRMVGTMLDRLRAQGSPGVHLGMWASNTRAFGFYTKLGFQELARVGESLYLGKKLR